MSPTAAFALVTAFLPGSGIPVFRVWLILFFFTNTTIRTLKKFDLESVTRVLIYSTNLKLNYPCPKTLINSEDFI